MKWKSNCADGIDFFFFLLSSASFFHTRGYTEWRCFAPICFTRELMMETEWGMKILSCLYEKWMKVFPWENWLPQELFWKLGACAVCSWKYLRSFWNDIYEKAVLFTIDTCGQSEILPKRDIYICGTLQRKL